MAGSADSYEQIIAEAQKLGYRPNPYARALKRRRTGIIALWIPDQISSHYTHVARELNLRSQLQDTDRTFKAAITSIVRLTATRCSR